MGFEKRIVVRGSVETFVSSTADWFGFPNSGLLCRTTSSICCVTSGLASVFRHMRSGESQMFFGDMENTSDQSLLQARDRVPLDEK